MSQPLEAQLWMAAARKSMALTFKAHKQHLASQVFEGRKELFCLFDITTQILLAMNNQQRRVDVLNVGDRRQTHVTIKAFPGRCIQFVVSKYPTKIARAEVRREVDHTTIGYGCFKAIGMDNQPVRHKAAITAACNAYALLFDIALLQQCINASHDILGILLAPGPSHRQRKLPTVTATTSRICVEHNI